MNNLLTYGEWAGASPYKSNNDEDTIKVLTVKSKKDECQFSVMETITGWLHGRRPWEKVFFRLLKQKGIIKAFVNLNRNDEKFYVVVKENSIEKMLELSEIYNNFLDSYQKYKSNPYFEFLVFSEEECSELSFNSDFVTLE